MLNVNAVKPLVVSNLFKKSNIIEKGVKSNLGLDTPKTTPVDYFQNFFNQSIFLPINSEQEYNRILNQLKETSSLLYPEKFVPLWNYRYDSYYSLADNNEKGLIFYAGIADYSDYINKYLSGRMKNLELNTRSCYLENISRELTMEEKAEIKKLRSYELPCPFSERTMCNIIRVLDYSLRFLDKKYGTYEGLVYRGGFIPRNNRQYLSTSKSPEVASIYGDESEMLSIIRVKNGHKIVDFQKANNNVIFEQGEQEILIDRKTKLKEIFPEQRDDELKNAVKQISNLTGRNDITCFEEI